MAGNSCLINYKVRRFIYKMCGVHNGSFDLGDVHIGKNTFIGINTIIVKPVAIGSNVILGGGSVVVSDIPDNVIAVGNPCKVIKGR